MDDLNWIYSMTTASTDSVSSSAVAVASLPYMARVTYEGMELLKRQRPANAKPMSLRHDAVIRAARHSIKLLDDTEKSLPSVIAQLDEIQSDHRRFLSNTLLSVITARGRLISSSRISSYQTAWTMSEATDGDGADSPHYKLSYEMGRTLAQIAVTFGYVPRPLPIDISGLQGAFHDVETSEYSQARYGAPLSVSAADVLMMSEAANNCALITLAPSREAFPGPVFRARMVAFTHAANAIKQILDTYPSDVANSEALAATLRSPDATKVLSLGALRNRCMHYGAPRGLSGLSPELPDYGLVQATSPGHTYSEINSALITTMQDLSASFGPWAAQQPSAA